MKEFKLRNKDWKSFPLDSLNFISSEAKEYLNYTIEESNKITNRSYSIVILLFAVLSGIVAYTFDKMVLDGFEKIITLNFCLVVVLIFILFQLGTLVFPRKIMAKGRIPKKIALTEFLTNPKLNKEEIYLAYIIQDIEVIQKKIDYNLLKNERRQGKLKMNMIAISLIFPIYLILAFFTTL